MCQDDELNSDEPQDQQDAPPDQLLEENRQNLIFYELVYQPKRIKLPDGWCGYQTFGGDTHRVFKGHEHFQDEDYWASHYSGPDFTIDSDAMRDVERHLQRWGLSRDYMEYLLVLVCPGWDLLKTEEEVLAFWFSLVNASARQRVQAAMAALAVAGRASRQILSFPLQPQVLDRVKRVLKLVRENTDAQGRASRDLGVMLRSAVAELSLEEARCVLALLHLGRGDQQDVNEAMVCVREHFHRHAAIFRQLYREPRLCELLTKGLELAPKE